MKSLIVWLILPFFLFSTEELVVQLETDKGLVPIQVEDKLTTSYHQELASIFRFDLNQSGRAYVAENGPAKLTLTFEPSSVSLLINDTRTRRVKKIHGIPLSHHLDTDRCRIHKLSDSVIETLFGTKGIASQKILFATQFPHPKVKGDYLSEIWECDYDGCNLRKLTNELSYSITPVHLPIPGHDDHFLYVCYKNGPPKIFSSLGGDPIIHLRGNQLLPTVSRDGRKIAFISDASGRADLFLQLFDPVKGPVGKPRQLYSIAGSVQASSSFSPDGNQLIFVSDRSGTPRLYLIDLKNLSSRRRPEAQCLTWKNRENTGPSFSPDGTKIAYSAKTNGIRQIWIYDLKSGEEKQLTDGPCHKENPCFAADSLHLVYNTTGREQSELYLINLNEKSPIQITSGQGKKHYPSWEL